MWRRLLRLRRTFRNLRRLRQITAILIRYGLTDIVRELRLQDLARRAWHWLRFRFEPLPAKTSQRPRSVRLALQELGPCFIKLGQLLSTRPDVIPAAYVNELQKLQDEVAPVPYAQIQEVLADEDLAASLEDLIEHIDEEALAVASIAQVHRARLRDGRTIALKIQRPDTERLFKTDLEILLDVAGFLERDALLAERYEPVRMVKELQRSMRRELDFLLEGRMVERFRRNFESRTEVVIPGVLWELTSRRVLALEYVDGTPLSDRASLLQRGLEPRRIARQVARAMFRQIFDHGLFHADPHPGNLIALDAPVIAFLDYGIVGSLDRTTRNQVLDFVHALVRKDSERMIRVAVDAGQVSRDVDLRDLRHMISMYLEQFADAPLGQIRIAEAVSEFLEVLRTHRIHFPSDLLLLAKAIMTLEGVTRELSPSFDLVREARPFVLRAMRKRYSPSRIARELGAAGLDYAHFMRQLPTRAGNLIDALYHGQLKIGFRHEGLEQFGHEFEKSTNRLALALVVAALLVTSALISLAQVGPYFGDLPVLGITGYALSGVLGLWLAIAIMRSGRL